MKQIKNEPLLLGIAKVVKELRDAKGLSQEEVMNEIKIQRNLSIHLGRIETATGNITVSSLSVLCDYFEIPISKFFLKVEKEIAKTK